MTHMPLLSMVVMLMIIMMMRISGQPQQVDDEAYAAAVYGCADHDAHDVED